MRSRALAWLGAGLCLVVAGCGTRTPPTTPSASTAARPTPPVASQSPALDQLRQDINTATQSAGVQRGAWGVVVQSLDRDERLFELNPRMLLVPASVAKLVAVATAAEAVGWDFRWETTVRANGRISDGVLQGDLIISGSGDPSIGGRGGADLTAWVEAIRAAGISRILGRVIGDDDAIEEPRPQLAWTWDDLGYPSGAMFGALNLNENRAALQIIPTTPGAPPGLAVPPALAHRQIINRVITGPTGSVQQLWPEQRPGEVALTIAGTIPAGASTATLNVAVGNPTLHFAHVLRERLIAAGIDVSAPPADIDDVSVPRERANQTLVHTHRSPRLAEIVQPLLKDSVNLYAEAVLRLNAPAGTVATNDAALEGMNARLAAWGLAAGEQQIVDGSGLSRRDVMSADAVVAVLKRMHAAGDGAPFITALPVASVDGSLANRMRGTPAAGNVRAKTGTMSNIRSLAGYVTTVDGERLAFALMVNNFEGTGAQANQALDAIAVRLAAFRRQ